MKLSLFSLALAALANIASAQTPTPCVLKCLNTAGSEAGCGTVNIKCMCASKKFQGDMLACVKAKCTPADLAVAEQLEKEFCGSS